MFKVKFSLDFVTKLNNIIIKTCENYITKIDNELIKM